VGAGVAWRWEENRGGRRRRVEKVESLNQGSSPTEWVVCYFLSLPIPLTNVFFLYTRQVPETTMSDIL